MSEHHAEPHTLPSRGCCEAGSRAFPQPCPWHPPTTVKHRGPVDLYGPWPPSTTQRLQQHVERIGAQRARLTDPTAQLQYELLAIFLATAEAAMDDEHVDPGTAQRVLDRVIYGCVPNPAEVAQRQRLLDALTDQFTNRPPAEGQPS